ncbi:hypothetical protein Csp2054_14495 [Curtobacterium sp. 'Ferrero']|uniref:hypothetical protein n=1 Tax=Curtobacterium sp. 'Ferrero' TaxID=2033654 RepID=UPI000BC79510|nr:hypothetical protein [Curtobacterium sp. 'Ferrero']PCN46916.1 hypothetical protein Csp2054_14495 [Curtobacterium sp. 'Ferrero']
MPTKTIAVLTAALAVTMLAGCSAGSSKAEQCTKFSERVSSAASGVQDSVANLQSDPDAAVSKLKDLDDKIKSGVSDISDADLKAKADDFENAYSGLITQIEAYAKDPQSVDVSKLTAASSKVQSTGKAFQSECTS